MSTCRTCQHLKRDSEMSRHGFFLCANGMNWKFWTLHHGCAKWEQAEPKQMEKREAWLAKRGM